MDNYYTNTSNFKLSIVSGIFGNMIKDVIWPPKEAIHQLFCICMNNAARNLCAYCALFYK